MARKPRVPFLLYIFSQSRQGAWGRAVCAYLVYRLGGYKVREIGEHFNLGPVVISYGLRKVEERFKY